MGSEGSLAWHIYCDTGDPFITVISADPLHSHLLQKVWQWSCQYLFNDLGMTRIGFEHQTFCLLGERSNRLPHRRQTSVE